MRKPEHRRAAERRDLRYPRDLTDAESALIEPAIPPAKRCGLPLVSMGMSEDFELAIRCGATHVRVGTAIFGPRNA